MRLAYAVIGVIAYDAITVSIEAAANSIWRYSHEPSLSDAADSLRTIFNFAIGSKIDAHMYVNTCAYYRNVIKLTFCQSKNRFYFFFTIF